MRVLAQGVGHVGSGVQGHRLAAQYFRGQVVRQLFATLYDKHTRRSELAWLYLCEHNVLLFANSLNDTPGVLLEIEPWDQVRVQPIDDRILGVILGSVSWAQPSVSVRTTGPICVLEINQQYAVLEGIQPKGTQGSFSWQTTYNTGKDYVAKMQNLAQQIWSVQRGGTARATGTLPGLSSGVMTANVIAVTIGAILTILFFLFVLLHALL